MRGLRGHPGLLHSVSLTLLIIIVRPLIPASLVIEDNVMAEARNLRNMTMAQTPLLGDENTPLHQAPGSGTGFGSATPQHQVAFTPNPLATPMYSGTNNISNTPREDPTAIAGTPLRTPVRDNLSINTADDAYGTGSAPPGRRHESAALRALKAGFKNLPEPENNFEIIVPEDDEEEAADDLEVTTEDAAERDERMRKLQEKAEREALARRSQAVKLNLPRPPNVDVDQLLKDLSTSEDGEVDEAQRLVNVELVRLMRHDSVAYPLPGTSLPGGTVSSYEMPPDDAISAALSEIHLEFAGSLGFPNANREQVREGIFALSKAELDQGVLWAHDEGELIRHMTSGASDSERLSDDERARVYNTVLDEKRTTMTKDASKAFKTERKLGVTLGGYQGRSAALGKRITEAFSGLQQAKLEYESFSRLKTNESAVGPRRVAALKEEVERLEQRERMLQGRYAELDAERREAQERLDAMEERIMAEAEALNEASLAE